MNVLKKNNWLVMVLVICVACKASKTKIHGDEQYEVCSEEANQLGEENYFMGIGEGKSINSQMSKQMARTEARNVLAEKMNTFVRQDIKVSKEQGTDPASYQENWDIKGQQLVSQKLQGLSTFCSKTFKNDAGLYTTFVGVRLDIEKQAFLKQIRKELGLSTY